MFQRISRSRSALVYVMTVFSVFIAGANTASAQCTAMTYTAHSPAYASTVTDLATPPLTVTFNYDVDASSITASNVYLYNWNTGARVDIRTSVSGKTLTIRPVNALAPSSQYRYVVMPGIRGIQTGCAPVLQSSHGNNFYTGPDCGGPFDIVSAPAILRQGCRYDVKYRHEPYANLSGGYDMTVGVTLGSFSYSRTEHADIDYWGLSIELSDVHFDAGSQKWVATAAKVYGLYESWVPEHAPVMLLNQFSNVPVTVSTGNVALTVTGGYQYAAPSLTAASLGSVATVVKRP